MTDTPTTPAPAPTATPTPAPPAPAPGSEEAELLALAASDQPTFEFYRGPDGTEKTGAEKLLAIQNAKKAETEKVAAQQEPTPPAATDEGADADADTGEEAEEPIREYDLGDYVYQPPEGQQVTEAGQELIAAFASHAHQSGMTPEAFESAIAWYNDRVAAQQQASRAEPAPKPEAQQSVAVQHAAAQDELARLDALLRTDIDTYRYKLWENTGVTASDRALQLRRQMAGEGPKKPSAAEVQAEVNRLVALSKSDPQLFQFGSWPGARSPADRLHAIRAGRV